MIAISNAISIGLNRLGGIDAQAQAHFNRVIADGGVVPAGVNGTNAFFNAVKAIYGTSDITTAVSIGVDAHYLGYKLGAGAGATSGQAVQKLYSCAGSAGDVVQTTAVSQPLLLAHNGASTDNYWAGLNSSCCISNTVISPTTQLDVKVELIASPNTTNGLTWISNDGAQRNFVFNCVDVTVGTLQLRAGTPFNNYNSTLGIGNLSNYSGWIRATYNQNGVNGDVTFYTSTNGTTWTQLGAVVTIASVVLATGTHTVQVGANQISNLYNGKIKRATISTTINGTSVVDFNPQIYNAATSQTQWTSATGEVWTINTGTAATGYKGVLVDRTTTQGDGVDDTLAATIAISGIKSAYWAITRLANAAKSVSDALVGNRFNLYTDATTSLSIYTNTGNLASSGLTRNILSQFAVVNNGASSTISKNDGVKTTGTLNNNTLTGIKLFNGADGFSNFHINTHIITSIADSNAQQTAMYNYIRSINNNAF